MVVGFEVWDGELDTAVLSSISRCLQINLFVPSVLLLVLWVATTCSISCRCVERKMRMSGTMYIEVNADDSFLSYRLASHELAELWQGRISSSGSNI